MRREIDLDDKVNVHERATKAAERTGSNGQKQMALHVPKPYAVDEDTTTLWESIKRLLPQPEVLDVAGRAVKGLVVPHWAAGVLLAAIISVGWTTYSKIADQRDMLIEMKTELKLAKEHELEYRNEFKTKLNVQQLQIDQLNLMKAVLMPPKQNGQRKDN